MSLISDIISSNGIKAIDKAELKQMFLQVLADTKIDGKGVTIKQNDNNDVVMDFFTASFFGLYEGILKIDAENDVRKASGDALDKIGVLNGKSRYKPTRARIGVYFYTTDLNYNFAPIENRYKDGDIVIDTGQGFNLVLDSGMTAPLEKTINGVKYIRAGGYFLASEVGYFDITNFTSGWEIITDKLGKLENLYSVGELSQRVFLNSATTLGRDSETDDDFRRRLTGLTGANFSLLRLESYFLSLSAVFDVRVYGSNAIPDSDANSLTVVLVPVQSSDLTIDDIDIELLEENIPIGTSFLGDKEIEYEYRGVKKSFKYIRYTPVWIHIEIDVKTIGGLSESLIEDLKIQIVAFFNGGKIGQDIDKAKLLKVILNSEAMEEATSVEIKSIKDQLGKEIESVGLYEKTLLQDTSKISITEIE